MEQLEAGRQGYRLSDHSCNQQGVHQRQEERKHQQEQDRENDHQNTEIQENILCESPGIQESGQYENL